MLLVCSLLAMYFSLVSRVFVYCILISYFLLFLLSHLGIISRGFEPSNFLSQWKSILVLLVTWGLLP